MAQAGLRQEVIDHLADSDWKEVNRFFIGRMGAGNLASSMIKASESPLHSKLFLLADWLPETLDKNEWHRDVLIGMGRMILDRDLPIVWRLRAILTMAKTGQEGVKAVLKQLLRETDPAVRQAALAGLAQATSREAVPILKRMFGDSEQWVRASSVHALAWMNEPIAERPLLEALLEPDEPLYRAAAEGLALNDSQESRKILLEAVDDAVLSVRRAAIYGLALLGDTWAMELLQSVAQEDRKSR